MARNNRTTGPESYKQRGEELINILENQLKNAGENTTSIRGILQILREEYPDIYRERQDLIMKARSAIGELHAESITWQNRNPERFIGNDGKLYIKSGEVRVARESLIDPRGNSYLKTMRSRIGTSPESKKEVSDSIINTILSSDGLPLTRGDDINEVNKLTLSGNKIEWYNIQNISVNSGDYLKISNGKVFLHETHRRKIEVGKVVGGFGNPIKGTAGVKPQISTAPLIYPSSVNAYSENMSFDSLKKSIDGFKLSENNGGLEERRRLALGLIARYIVHNSIRSKKTLSFQYAGEKVSFENGNSLSFPGIQESSIHDAVHQYFLVTYFKNHFSSENLYDYFAKKLTNPKQNYEKLKTDLEDGKKVEEILKKSMPGLEPILSYYGESKLRDFGILIKAKMFLGGNSQMLSQTSWEDKLVPESLRANWDSINPAAKGILVYGALLYGGFQILSALWNATIGNEKVGWIKSILGLAGFEVMYGLATGESLTQKSVNAVASLFSGGTDEKKYNALKGTLQSSQKEMDLGNFKGLALGLLSQSNNFVDLSWIETGRGEEYQNKSINMICEIANISKAELRKRIEEGRNGIISSLNLQNITPQDIAQISGSSNFAGKLAIAIKRKDVIESFIANNLANTPRGTSENDFKKKFADSFKKFIRTGESTEIDLGTQLGSGGKVKLESNDSPVNTLSPSISPQENETELKKEIIAFIEALKSFGDINNSSFESEIEKLARKLNKPKDVVKTLVQKEIDGKLSELKLGYEDSSKEINFTDLGKVSGTTFKEKHDTVKARIIGIINFNKNGGFDTIGVTWSTLKEKLSLQFKEYLISGAPQEFDVKEVFGVEGVGKITIR